LHEEGIGMIAIGSCMLGTAPRVVGVVDELVPFGKLLMLEGVADILEMRIDCFRQPVDRITAYLGEIRAKVALPMIGTVRENEFTRENRSGIFKAVMPYVDCIDIELGAPISDEVLSLASGKTVIVSEHDFNGTPDTRALRTMVDRAVVQGAEIVKIAVMATCREDVVRVLEFTRSCEEPVVTMVMGPLGTISRVVGPLFGSLLTYGYLTRPVAPGQLSVQKLAEEIRRYYPGAG
jgi:3-dehydroquinate dehydratase-1